MADPPKQTAKPVNSVRRDRLAAELRRNLKRRKARDRALKAPDAERLDEPSHAVPSASQKME